MADQAQKHDAQDPNQHATANAPNANEALNSSAIPAPAVPPAAAGVSLESFDNTHGYAFLSHDMHNHFYLPDLGTTLRSVREGGNLGNIGDESIHQIAQAILAASASMLPGSSPRDAEIGATRPRPEHMPETYELIEDWFCVTLTDRERCAVRATAVLHGAPAAEVAEAREELYQALHERNLHDPPNQQPQLTEQRLSSRELMANTFNEPRETGVARRVYWLDVESNGYSAFGLMVLRLLAGEIEGTAGVLGQNILPILEQWASMAHDGERAWRTAHALGVIWWRLDQGRLRATARKWALSSRMQERASAAWMLYGAYEIERSETEHTDSSSRARQPMIVKLLRQWAEESLNPNTDENLAGVVVSTYGLIGRKWPEIALDGLDHLLGLAPENQNAPLKALPISAFIQAALTYTSLAWIGNTRAVVARLATHAESLIQRPRHAALTKESTFARHWREFGLNALFFVFMLLVSSSFEESDTSQEHNRDASAKDYGAEATLPEDLPIPYAQNRDTLLAGILAQRELQFRNELITLLSAAFSHERPVQAAQILRIWAGTVLRQQSDHAPSLRLTFLRFMEEIGRQIRAWDNDMQAKGMLVGFDKYVKQLERWPRKDATCIFADNTLVRLGVRDA